MERILESRKIFIVYMVLISVLVVAGGILLVGSILEGEYVEIEKAVVWENEIENNRFYIGKKDNKSEKEIVALLERNEEVENFSEEEFIISDEEIDEISENKVESEVKQEIQEDIEITYSGNMEYLEIGENELNNNINENNIETAKNREKMQTENLIEGENVKSEENINNNSQENINNDSDIQEEIEKTEIADKATDEVEEIEAEYKGYQTVGKIEIPNTGVNTPILSSVTVEGMENAPCLLYQTGELNKSGNNLIVGHNYRNGTIFSDNENLEIGDKIYITTLDGKKVGYTIYEKFITTPEDISYIKRDTGNNTEITLSCCTDDDVNRIIILAKAE